MSKGPYYEPAKRKAWAMPLDELKAKVARFVDWDDGDGGTLTSYLLAEEDAYREVLTERLKSEPGSQP